MRQSHSVLILVLALCLGMTSHAIENPVDRIVVLKSKRSMTLYKGQTVVRQYEVSLGPEPVGAKTRQGDHRTPEGTYTISGRNPRSQYYRSLRISYPNRKDRERARRLGVSPGGDIMIHGLPNGKGFLGKAHLQWDWTDGCIAVTNEEMDEIWRMVANGTMIVIEP